MGRPRTPLIDRERITTAALELIDETGDFGMVRVARRLGVQTGSLYHHVQGRDGVIELVRARLASAIRTEMFAELPWDEAMAAWARSYRAAFAAHPRVIPLVMISPVRSPLVLAQYEQAVRSLLESGFAMNDVMKVIIAMDNLVMGSALDLAAPDTMWEPADHTSTPLLAQALAVEPEGRGDAAFELALDACLTRFRTMAGDGGTAA
ncbi:TetR/AcrR family transcriptional regulator C-terminal domain-containing protein [Streptomyces sp. CAU 1734]|uniref:TetR/AcrR family transcriptional regulator C-terminal domain-containing protein n=1 Tax=Streptomyces sp. CAU 1734 TaxID=3140360 RepID=UPI003260A3AE